jgi:hypothetical protein
MDADLAALHESAHAVFSIVHGATIATVDRTATLLATPVDTIPHFVHLCMRVSGVVGVSLETAMPIDYGRWFLGSDSDWVTELTAGYTDPLAARTKAEAHVTHFFQQKPAGQVRWECMTALARDLMRHGKTGLECHYFVESWPGMTDCPLLHIEPPRVPRAPVPRAFHELSELQANVELARLMQRQPTRWTYGLYS